MIKWMITTKAWRQRWVLSDSQDGAKLLASKLFKRMRCPVLRRLPLLSPTIILNTMSNTTDYNNDIPTTPVPGTPVPADGPGSPVPHVDTPYPETPVPHVDTPRPGTPIPQPPALNSPFEATIPEATGADEGAVDHADVPADEGATTPKLVDDGPEPGVTGEGDVSTPTPKDSTDAGTETEADAEADAEAEAAVTDDGVATPTPKESVGDGIEAAEPTEKVPGPNTGASTGDVEDGEILPGDTDEDVNTKADVDAPNSEHAAAGN